MRGTEILLLIAVAVLIFYIVLREPAQTTGMLWFRPIPKLCQNIMVLQPPNLRPLDSMKNQGHSPGLFI